MLPFAPRNLQSFYQNQAEVQDTLAGLNERGYFTVHSMPRQVMQQRQDHFIQGLRSCLERRRELALSERLVPSRPLSARMVQVLEKLSGSAGQIHYKEAFELNQPLLDNTPLASLHLCEIALCGALLKGQGPSTLTPLVTDLIRHFHAHTAMACPDWEKRLGSFIENEISYLKGFLDKKGLEKKTIDVRLEQARAEVTTFLASKDMASLRQDSLQTIIKNSDNLVCHKPFKPEYPLLPAYPSDTASKLEEDITECQQLLVELNKAPGKPEDTCLDDAFDTLVRLRKTLMKACHQAWLKPEEKRRVQYLSTLLFQLHCTLYTHSNCSRELKETFFSQPDSHQPCAWLNQRKLPGNMLRHYERLHPGTADDDGFMDQQVISCTPTSELKPAFHYIIQQHPVTGELRLLIESPDKRRALLSSYTSVNLQLGYCEWLNQFTDQEVNTHIRQVRDPDNPLGLKRPVLSQSLSPRQQILQNISKPDRTLQEQARERSEHVLFNESLTLISHLDQYRTELSEAVDQHTIELADQALSHARSKNSSLRELSDSPAAQKLANHLTIAAYRLNSTLNQLCPEGPIKNAMLNHLKAPSAFLGVCRKDGIKTRQFELLHDTVPDSEGYRDQQVITVTLNGYLEPSFCYIVQFREKPPRLRIVLEDHGRKPIHWSSDRIQADYFDLAHRLHGEARTYITQLLQKTFPELESDKPERPLSIPPEPVTPAAVQERMEALKWPTISSRYSSYIGQQLRSLTHVCKKTKNQAAESRARSYYHKALLLHRLNKIPESRDALKVACELSITTVEEQLKLSEALLLVSTPPSGSDPTSEERAHGALKLLHHHSQCGDVLPTVELLATGLGLMNPDAHPGYSPGWLSQLICRLAGNLDSSRHPEANFITPMHLSFALREPVYLNDDSLTDDQIVLRQFIWVAMGCHAREQAISLSHHPTRGLSQEIMKQYIELFTFFRSDHSEVPPTPEFQAALKGLKQRYETIRHRLTDQPLAGAEAIDVLVLLTASKQGLTQWLPREELAKLLEVAADYPPFSGLLAEAAHLYQQTVQFNKAAECFYKLSDIWPGKASEQQKLIAMAEHCRQEEEDYQSIQQRALAQMGKGGAAAPLIETVATQTIENSPNASVPLPDSRKKASQPKAETTAPTHNRKKARPASKPTHTKPEPAVQPVTRQSTDAYYEQKEIQETPQREAHAPDCLPEYAHRNPAILEAIGRYQKACAADDLAQQLTIIQTRFRGLGNKPEVYLVHYHTAWHFLKQIDLPRHQRVTLNKSGEPADDETLCQEARRKLAHAFECLTGLRISPNISPEKMGQLLMNHYPAIRPVPDSQQPFRKALQAIMSSFGHTYSHMADLSVRHREAGATTRGFYRLKKLANPDCFT